MVGEKMDLHSSENIDKNTEAVGNSDYPPFDPDKAKELVANTKMLSSTKEISDDKLRQKVLDREDELKKRQERIKRDEEIARLADEAEARLGRNLSQAELQDMAEKYDAWLKNKIDNKAENQTASSEYDFRSADRYQEDTFILAAANSLVDSPDIAYVDSTMLNARERANKNNMSIFEALKSLSKESNPDTEGGWAAIDLQGAFIDTTTTYVISKDEKIGRGFAKGLLTKLEMTIDGATTDKSNPQVDKLRVDLALVKPIAEEFIKNYSPEAYDNPNNFRDYLKATLEMEESDIRSISRRGEQPSPDAERRVQAIKSAMEELARMQANYEENLKKLHDTAHENHRVI